MTCVSKASSHKAKVILDYVLVIWGIIILITTYFFGDDRTLIASQITQTFTSNNTIDTQSMVGALLLNRSNNKSENEG